jgi:DNA-binding MarR family transcriptional regulator
MTTKTRLGPELCNCLAVRQAARHITQFYDQCLAPSGFAHTQFSILAKLKRVGPMTINALAAEIVMDRTTLGRNILPLQREGLIAVVKGKTDRRSKELRVTEAGAERLRAAVKGWVEAQTRFEAVFGPDRTAELRALLYAVSAPPTATMSYPKRHPDRANLHFLRLAEHLNMGNPAMADLLQRVTAVNTAKCGGDVVHGHAAD